MKTRLAIRHPVRLIAGRELRDQLRDWRILLPLIILTLILPFLADFGAQAAIDLTTRYGTPLIAERLVPFLLMVVGYFPITVSLIIALESFVGEKERGTIEPLLVSPIKDWQLFIGKLIAGTTAPLSTSYLGITIYMVGLSIRHITLPDPNRLLQTLVLTTLQAILMVSAAILISTQATSVRAANLMASFIVIPVAILIQGESIMLFWGNDQALWLAVLGVAVLTALFIRMGISHFQREALLGHEIDFLNLRWMTRAFWLNFKGEAGNIASWLRLEIPKTIKKQVPAILIIIALGSVAALAAGFWVNQNSTQVAAQFTSGGFSQILSAGMGSPVSSKGIPFQTIWGHNLQAIAVILLLGMVSCGVLGVVIYLLNVGIVGAVLALIQVTGGSPVKIGLAGILPHGIFEIPALILASAAVFQIGILLVTPNPRRSLGEVMIAAFADWAKVTVSMVIPLLTIAAMVEAWVTPWLLSLVVK